MFKIIYTGRFKKDYKRIVKRNLDLKKLAAVYKLLQKTGTLPVDRYMTHILKGNYKGHFEAHIEPDWLIIWLKKGVEIRLVRTGTHSDLF